MLVCVKRTTLVLEEGVLEGIRQEAHVEGMDMSELVNEFLRQGLIRRREKVKPLSKLPVFSMGEPRVNLADRDALEQLMES
jgi:hypothetical protein